MPGNHRNERNERQRETRRYRKKKRARNELETRRRITEAAVELHGTVGPAQTSVTDVAKLAGVSRMTVYAHFPDDVDLFMACSTHWAQGNPFPDPAGWAAVEDPAERLGRAVKEMYQWYARKEYMLGKVLRDLPQLPALAEVMDELWTPYMGQVVDTLAAGWPVEQAASGASRAALRLAVDFGTWRLLTSAGLSTFDAARLAAHMANAAIIEGIAAPQ